LETTVFQETLDQGGTGAGFDETLEDVPDRFGLAFVP